MRNFFNPYKGRDFHKKFQMNPVERVLITLILCSAIIYLEIIKKMEKITEENRTDSIIDSIKNEMTNEDYLWFHEMQKKGPAKLLLLMNEKISAIPQNASVNFLIRVEHLENAEKPYNTSIFMVEDKDWSAMATILSTIINENNENNEKQ